MLLDGGTVFRISMSLTSHTLCRSLSWFVPLLPPAPPLTPSFSVPPPPFSVMIPLQEICNRQRTKVDVHSRMWHRVLACTNQPSLCSVRAESPPPAKAVKPSNLLDVSAVPVEPPSVSAAPK